MKKLLTTLLLLICLNGFCDYNEKNFNEAKKHIQKAILKLPKIRKAKRRLEKYIIKKIPLEKETISFLGSLAMTAYQGKLNTKIIKNMDIDVLGGDLRPDIGYNFNNSEFKSTANLTWSF